MAAPTVGSEQDIQVRLESLLDDAPKAPEKPEDSKATNDDDLPKVELKDDDTQVVVDDDGGEEKPVVEVKPKEGEGEETDGEEEGINTLADIAQVFEVEEKELLEHLQISSPNGETVALGEVIKTWRDAPAATRDYEQLKLQREAFLQESAQLRERTDQATRDLAAHAQALLDVTQEEFKDIDWKTLEQEDPQSYLILKNKSAERGALIQGAIEKLKFAEKQKLEEFQAQTVKTRATEIAALHEKMPEWSDPEVAGAAMNETQQFLIASNFSQDEVNTIGDHRYLLVAWKAAQFDKLKKNAPKKMKKLRGLPKPTNALQAGARRDASADVRKKAQAKFDRLKQTGDERDAAALLEEFL